MNIDLKKVKLKNGKSIERAFRDEANRFLCILQRNIDVFYASYEPKAYERTFGLKNSIYVADYIRWKKDGLQMKICFTDEAYHKSLFSNERVNVIQLMNDGFEIKKDVWFKNVPGMGFREPAHFIEKSITEFEKNNYLGLVITIEY